MAGREELVDAIAGFALFADLTAPQLEGIVHTFDEAVFGEGERILRQGLSGSGFYVILDGEAAIVVDGTERARLGRGDFFGEVSILLGETPIADVVATAADALPGPRRARRSRRSSSPIRGSCTGCSRRRRAGCGPRTDGGADPPVPARVLSGHRHRQRTRRAPGLVLAARSRACAHAVLSADPAPGGMFRRWPFFQRLLSWTKPYAPVARGHARVRALRLEQPARRGARRRARSRRPSWTARRTSRRARRWRRTWRRSRSGPRSRSATTALDRDAAARWPGGRRTASRSRPSTGAYTCADPGHGGRRRRAVHRRPGPGWSTPTTTPTSARPRPTPAGGSCIIGKQNSGFELANGPAPVGAPARAGVAVARQAVGRHELARRGPGALRPAVRGPRPGRRRVDPRRRDRPGRAPRRRGADRQPAADRRRRRHPRRGRRRHLGDRVRGAAAATCRRSGVATFGASALPVVTPVVGEHERARDLRRRHARPGGQGAPAPRPAGELRGGPRGALQRPGPGRPHRARPGSASSRAATGDRPRPHAVGWLATELAEAPELFHQRGYLARVLTADPDGSLRDDGVQPLAHILDTGGPDAVAITLEADGSGSIYPVLFTAARRHRQRADDRAGPARAARHAATRAPR